MQKKKSILISVLCGLALVLVMVWFGTSGLRYRNSAMEKITAEIAENRGESYPYFALYLDSTKLNHDKTFQSFLAAQAEELSQNREYGLLYGLLEELEECEVKVASVVDALNAAALSSGRVADAASLVSCLSDLDYYTLPTVIPSIVERMESDEAYLGSATAELQELCVNDGLGTVRSFLLALLRSDIRSDTVVRILEQCLAACETIEDAELVASNLRGIDYYGEHMRLNKNSGIIAEYIRVHGENPITQTPGEGYYADQEDSRWRKRIGISGSSLYEARETTHLGDFKCVYEHGRDLDRSTYTEVSYGGKAYYFRGHMIGFRPEEGECVWSGDYLFLFADGANSLYAKGELLNMEKLS